MTGLDKIIGRILSDADSYAEDVIRQAEVKAEDVITDAEDEARKASIARARAAKTDAETVLARAESSSVLTERNIMLGARTELIDEAFAEAEKMICSLGAQDYGKLLNMQLEAVLRDAPDADYTIFPSEGDEAVISKLIEGRKSIKLGESRKLGGGFVLRSGDIEMNCSVRAIVSSLRNEMSAEVRSVLFD